MGVLLYRAQNLLGCDVAKVRFGVVKIKCGVDKVGCGVAKVRCSVPKVVCGGASRGVALINCGLVFKKLLSKRLA